MATRSTAPSGTFFPVSVLVSLIVLIGTLFAVLQTANLSFLPSWSFSRTVARAPFFRGLVYLPQFRFIPLFRGVEPDSAPDATPDESHMSPAELIDRWKPFISEASQRFGVPEKWIRTIIQIESGGRTMLLGRPITSGAGAMGVMQLMGDTYNDMSTQNGLGSDPYNVHDNIMAGTAYLSQLYKRYGYPRMFAAYNAGPGVLEAHMTRGASLPQETRNYVRMAVNSTASPWSIKGLLALVFGSPATKVKPVSVKAVKAVTVAKTIAKIANVKLAAQKITAPVRHGGKTMVAARQLHVAAVTPSGATARVTHGTARQVHLAAVTPGHAKAHATRPAAPSTSASTTVKAKHHAAAAA